MLDNLVYSLCIKLLTKSLLDCKDSEKKCMTKENMHCIETE